VYWTARCTKDPWLQGGTCQRLGEYVPGDIREAFPSVIGGKPFPLTKDALSAMLKQQLIKQYQAANPQAPARMSNQQRIQSMMTEPKQAPIAKQPPSTQAMAVQPQQPQVITQSQAANAMETQSQSALPKTQVPTGALARSGLFSRGVAEKEGEAQADSAAVTGSDGPEITEMAVVGEGTPELPEAVALKLEAPFHTTGSEGSPIELKPGVYEIGTIMDLQLGLAREGQETVLLDATRDRHSFPITKTFAAVIPGPSDDVHLLYLTPDGRRFEVVGYPSAVKPRSLDTMAPLPDKTIEAAVRAASVSPRAVSSPPCRPNPNKIGPRWVPVPCTMPTQTTQSSKP